MRADLVPGPGDNLLARVAGRVAHDLNNSISILAGHLYLLRNAAEPAEEAADAMGKAVAQIELLSKRLEWLGAIGQSSPHTVDLNAVARDAAAGPTHGAGPVELDLDRDLPAFTGRSDDIRRALDCLLWNAREASTPGAPVRIVTRNLADGAILLAVEDAGAGIPPESRLRVFQPFFSTRGERGRGLGLTVVEAVAASHGGSCDFEPRPEGGIRFRLRFPQSRPTGR